MHNNNNKNLQSQTFQLPPIDFQEMHQLPDRILHFSYPLPALPKSDPSPITHPLHQSFERPPSNLNNMTYMSAKTTPTTTQTSQNDKSRFSQLNDPSTFKKSITSRSTPPQFGAKFFNHKQPRTKSPYASQSKLLQGFGLFKPERPRAKDDPSLDQSSSGHPEGQIKSLDAPLGSLQVDTQRPIFFVQENFQSYQPAVNTKSNTPEPYVKPYSPSPALTQQIAPNESLPPPSLNITSAKPNIKKTSPKHSPEHRSPPDSFCVSNHSQSSPTICRSAPSPDKGSSGIASSSSSSSSARSYSIVNPFYKAPGSFLGAFQSTSFAFVDRSTVSSSYSLGSPNSDKMSIRNIID